MRTSKTTQQYIGCILSIARATLCDHPVWAEAQDEEALEEAIQIVSNLMLREASKNRSRGEGFLLHVSDIEGRKGVEE